MAKLGDCADCDFYQELPSERKMAESFEGE